MFHSTILLQSLSAPVAFSIGSSYMMQLEILETGLQWSSLNVQPVSPPLLAVISVKRRGQIWVREDIVCSVRGRSYMDHTFGCVGISGFQSTTYRGSCDAQHTKGHVMHNIQRVM